MMLTCCPSNCSRSIRSTGSALRVSGVSTSGSRMYGSWIRSAATFK